MNARNVELGCRYDGNILNPESVEDFLNVGEIVAYYRNCGCEDCVESLGEMVEDLTTRKMEIGFRLHQMAKYGENLPLLFRGQMEDWTIKQFRDAMTQQREALEKQKCR